MVKSQTWIVQVNSHSLATQCTNIVKKQSAAVRPLAPCYHSALALSNASSFSELQLHFSVSSHLACLADLLGRAKIVSIPLNARTRARDRLFPSPNSTHFFFSPSALLFLVSSIPSLNLCAFHSLHWWSVSSHVRQETREIYWTSPTASRPDRDVHTTQVSDLAMQLQQSTLE